jgi:hypothetical protein
MPRHSAGAGTAIKMRRAQPSVGDGLIAIEVANLVYRNFSRAGGAKMPDAKIIGRRGVALGHRILLRRERDRGEQGRRLDVVADNLLNISRAPKKQSAT